MNLQALRFLSRSPGGRPVQTSIDAQSSAAFAKSVAGDGAGAFVVRTRDLEPLRRFDDVIIDRGVKHKAKPLSKLLLGQKRIPIIDGNYTHPGRLTRAVRGLLLRAVKHGEHGHYVVGVTDALFEKLWNGHGTQFSDASNPAALPSGFLSAQQVLDRIPKRAVPQELRARWYVGASPRAELVRQWVLLAGELDEPVLITGPTGTGKDNVARAIHYFGTRRDKPFVAVNTAAITSTLFESELFGYVRGAFTGATRSKEGFWEAARDGTVFLDEIGDLDLDLQKKILRALDRNEIIRVGATKPVEVGARVVAATNRDLDAMVQNGQFRGDL